MSSSWHSSCSWLILSNDRWQVPSGPSQTRRLIAALRAFIWIQNIAHKSPLELKYGSYAKLKDARPHHNKHLLLSYLKDVFNIKFNIEGEFNIPGGKDGLSCATVPAQTTEGASVACSLFICSKTNVESQSFLRCDLMSNVFYLTVIPSRGWRA